MPSPLHYRSPGADRVACSQSNLNPNTNFTLDVTCPRCKGTLEFRRAHSAFMTVVDSWSSPKEDQLSKLGHLKGTTQ